LRKKKRGLPLPIAIGTLQRTGRKGERKEAKRVNKEKEKNEKKCI